MSADQPAARSACESEILRALAQADPEVGKDHEDIWQGYLDGYTPQAVSRALVRLRRQGLIESYQRGWYRLPRDGGA